MPFSRFGIDIRKDCQAGGKNQQLTNRIKGNETEGRRCQTFFSSTGQEMCFSIYALLLGFTDVTSYLIHGTWSQSSCKSTQALPGTWPGEKLQKLEIQGLLNI